MTVPITTPQVLSRLGIFKDDLRPFTGVTVPFPKRETVKDPLWSGYFIMPHTERLNDLHGRTMVNVVSGESFHIHAKNSWRLPKPPGWLSLRTMEDNINHILSRTESKFCAPNGTPCTSRTVGLLARRHIVAGEFHYIRKEASTRWAGGVDLSMMPEAGAVDPADKTCREYERVVDAKCLDQIRTEAKQFSNKLLSRRSGVARCANKLQEGEKHHQTAYFAKADKGHTRSAKQKDEELTGDLQALAPYREWSISVLAIFQHLRRYKGFLSHTQFVVDYVRHPSQVGRHQRWA